MALIAPVQSDAAGRFKILLDGLYDHYNDFCHIHPDPLEFVYHYEGKLDREIAGIIASSLAYGRVRQILLSVGAVLELMRPSPSAFLLKNSPSEIRNAFDFFKHRFTTGEILAGLLVGLRNILEDHGSLESCFLSGFSIKNENILPALSLFVEKLQSAAGRKMPMFLPSPDGGSACKRLNLFLRWMVRRDKVDPGTWESVPASHLVIPLDTHMHRIAGAMGLTDRKQADIRCAIEVTRAFGFVYPVDPVRCDFALTRLGMNNGPRPDNLCKGLQFIYQ